MPVLVLYLCVRAFESQPSKHNTAAVFKKSAAGLLSSEIAENPSLILTTGIAEGLHKISFLLRNLQMKHYYGEKRANNCRRIAVQQTDPDIRKVKAGKGGISSTTSGGKSFTGCTHKIHSSIYTSSYNRHGGQPVRRTWRLYRRRKVLLRYGDRASQPYIYPLSCVFLPLL